MKQFTEPEIQAFVDKETASWKPLPDCVFIGVPDDITVVAKQGDREQLQISYDELLTVIHQRREKESFAYQYSLWMTDYTTTILDFMRNPRGETQEIQTAMLNVVKNGLHCKLVAMERWYHTAFTDTPHSESPDQEMLAVAKAYSPSKIAPSSPENSPQSRGPSSRNNPETGSGYGWIVGVVVALILLWLCSGGLSSNKNYDPYKDDPLSDPDLYREGPWPR